jgi:hypothetical protein
VGRCRPSFFLIGERKSTETFITTWTGRPLSRVGLNRHWRTASTAPAPADSFALKRWRGLPAEASPERRAKAGDPNVSPVGTQCLAGSVKLTASGKRRRFRIPLSQPHKPCSTECPRHDHSMRPLPTFWTISSALNVLSSSSPAAPHRSTRLGGGRGVRTSPSLEPQTAANTGGLGASGSHQNQLWRRRCALNIW